MALFTWSFLNIQYSVRSKSSHGIIGQSRKQEYAAEWALKYHEVLSTTNTIRDMTNLDEEENTETANAFAHYHLRSRNFKRSLLEQAASHVI